MGTNELETTVDELEQEVLDELGNPYKPYSVIFPYEVRLTIPEIDYPQFDNTEITIRTRSEQVRFGRNERDVFLQTEVDFRYGKDTYSKHILKFLCKILADIDPRTCDLEYLDKPIITPISHQETKDFTDECLNNE